MWKLFSYPVSAIFAIASRSHRRCLCNYLLLLMGSLAVSLNDADAVEPGQVDLSVLEPVDDSHLAFRGDIVVELAPGTPLTDLVLGLTVNGQTRTRQLISSRLKRRRARIRRAPHIAFLKSAFHSASRTVQSVRTLSALI